MRSSSSDSTSVSESSRAPSSISKKEKDLALKKRNRRKTLRAKRGGDVQEGQGLARRKASERVSSSSHTHAVDHVRNLDVHLAKGAQAHAARRKSKQVQIHFGAHEPSAHMIRLQGMARRIPVNLRDPKARSMHAWVAPCDPPPSLDRMAAEALDLYISELDVRELYTQFTPFDPEIAYRERRALWERLRAPFMRWELVWHPVSEEVIVTDDIVETESQKELAEELVNVIVPPRSLDTEYAVESPGLPSGFEEQFTTGQIPSPQLRSWNRLRHRMGDFVESVMDRVKIDEEEVIQEAEQVLSVPMLVPRVHFVRVFAGLLLLLCLVSLPAGAVSLSRSFSGSITKTMAAGQDATREVQGAFQGGVLKKEALNEASAQFAIANNELTQANGFATAIVQALPKTREVYRAGRLLLEAGKKGTRAAEIMTEGMTRAWQQSVSHPDERLLSLQTHLQAVQPLLEEATKAVSDVDIQALPLSTRARVTALRDSLTQGETAVKEIQQLVDLGITTVGHDRPRTYLFIFQNQTELRPTGGFMGSIAEVVFDRGEIRSMRVPGGGPYDLRNQLLTRVRPPEPLQLVSSRWEFQDANWFPDFPTAAKKINWFWSQAGQPTLDGIVTINARVLQDLLRVTGPITLSEYGKTFDADNVLLELQKSVELEYNKTENKPKKIIGDLLPRVLEQLRGTSQKQMLTLMESLGTSLRTKDIQIWFHDTEEQAVIADMGWSGAFPEVIGDTLAVNEANIGGQKTDAVINEKVDHDIAIQEDGQVFDTVTLSRQHAGEKGELFHGANNVAYVRLYAPLGSELLSATGFQPPAKTAYKQILPEDPMDADVEATEVPRFIDPSSVQVTEEYGRTVFGGWVQLGPGASSTTTFRYKLPVNARELSDRLKEEKISSVTISPSQSSNRAAYLLSVISQSGKPSRGLTIRIHTPADWKMAWSNQIWQEQDQARLLDLAAWDRDQVIALLFDIPHAETY